ncbi:amidohydrolase family protein [Gracilibacillus caseinilyticus]|uniref:Amidohydrolase family protein n=1 Tax=Gracilibacillus caseinilyticus TaxID=2932256 RepID=A0ABY4EQG2_9BACI|nr:amidohydrolase family protein [Gracilibacillus caseinilyticus]UOQ46605.1 amidohydrolase family protein [Gracilibacillus caseinilyticus]
MLDLLFHNVTIPHSSERMDVGISDGIITYLAKTEDEVAPAKEVIEADGRVLLPGLVEPHIHLDKAYLLDQMEQDATNLTEAIQFTSDLKKSFTKEDIRRRSVKVLEKCVGYGVTHLRCHVEVDPIVGLKGMEVLLELRETFRDQVEIQLVVFPQEGIFKQPGTTDLMEKAMLLGADVVGGIPYNDNDAVEHIDFVFALAAKCNKPIDFHVDFSDDPTQLAIRDIVKRTLAYGYQGKVSVGHLTSLASVPYDEAKLIAADIAKAGISVMALPATDLFLNGRSDQERVRRGVTPVKLLLEKGANVSFGTNNIQNPFTPFGTGDPLDIALLLAHVAQLGTRQDAELLLDMATVQAAKAIGLKDHGIALYNKADFILFDTTNPRQILLERPPRQTIWKRGVKQRTIVTERR